MHNGTGYADAGGYELWTDNIRGTFYWFDGRDLSSAGENTVTSIDDIEKKFVSNQVTMTLNTSTTGGFAESLAVGATALLLTGSALFM